MNSFKILSEKPAATIISPSMIERRVDAGCFQPTYLKNESNLLNGSVPHARLGSLFSKGNYGSLPDSVDYASDGIALIRGTDLQSMAVNLSDAVRVPGYYYDQFTKAQIKSGDILMLVKGASIDRSDSVAMFSDTDDKAIANGSVFIIRVNERKVNSKYLLAVMTSVPFLLQKRRGSSNTGALYNDIDTIKAFVIPLPDDKMQSHLGNKVKTAENCREEAFKCEKQAEIIFNQYWSATTITLSGSFTTTTGIGVLDNDRLDPEFYRNDLLTMRERVRKNKNGYVRVGKCGESFSGKTPSDKGSDDSLCEIVRVANLTSRGLDWSNRLFGTIGKSEKGLLKDGDIIVCKDAHQKYYIGQQVDIYCRPNHHAVASSETLVIRFQREHVNPFSALFYLRSKEGYAAFQQQIRGTSAHLYPTDVENIVVPKIPEDAEELIEQLIRRAEHCRIRAYALTDEAKADVEALIEGKLDTDAIMSGKLKAPTWEDIEKELEGI
jgi:type I restriction enzyme S subunit